VISISQSQFESLLFATHSCQFISLTAVTDPAMRKRQNPYLGARKVSLVVGAINWQYSRTVNRQRGREQKLMDFKALERTWGTRIKQTPLVSHVCGPDGETRLYLEVKIERRSTFYFDRNTHQRIDEAAIEPFLTKPDEQPRQGLDREIVLRDFALKNIAELSMAGEQYTIAPAASELQLYFPAPKPSPPKRGRRRTPTTARPSARGAKVKP